VPTELESVARQDRLIDFTFHNDNGKQQLARGPRINIVYSRVKHRVFIGSNYATASRK